MHRKIRNILIPLLLFVIILNTGCKDNKEMKYSFEAVNDLNLITHSSNIINILEISDFASNYNEKCVKIQGQLISLFGEPAYTTLDLNNAYCYVIMATSNNGVQYVLSAYVGSSGPAIGGDISVEGIDECAVALKEAIQKANPSDYEYEGYYFDGPTKIYQKIENGECYYSETEIGQEEYEKAYEKCYPSEPTN